MNLNSKSSGKAAIFFFWAVIIIVVVAFGALVLWRNQPPEAQQDPSTMPRPVSIVEVTPRPVDVTYVTQGTLEARNRIDMNPEIQGIITRIPVHEGQYVSRGTVLMQMKAERQSADVARSQAAVSSARASLESAKAQYQLAESEYNRYKTLRQRDLISELELEQKRATYESARANLEASEQALEESKASLEYTRAASGETLIRAPFSGTIGEKYVDVGDYVTYIDKLITMVDNQEMKVRFTVPERFTSHLKKGRAVQISIEGLKKKLTAHVSFVAPAIDPATRTLTVKADLKDETSLNLRDGQFTKVRLTLETVEDGLVLPEEALVPQGEKYFIFKAIPSDNPQFMKAEMIEVTLGERQPGWAQVTSGLEPGEKVVSDGVQKIFDGALLIDKAAMEAAQRAQAKKPEQPETQQ